MATRKTEDQTEAPTDFSTENYVDVDLFEIPDCTGAVEPMAVPSGEYKLKVTGWKIDKNTNGNDYIMALLQVTEPEVVAAAGQTYYMEVPKVETMTPKDLNSAMLKMKRFNSAFGIEKLNPAGRAEALGKEAWALVSCKPEVVKEGKKSFADTGGNINNIQRWV